MTTAISTFDSFFSRLLRRIGKAFRFSAEAGNYRWPLVTSFSAFSTSWRAKVYGKNYQEQLALKTLPNADEGGDFRKFLDSKVSGRVMFKWLHYFEIFERHLQKFQGKNATLVEVGCAGGGSLEMWKKCLGPGATIHGIDIQAACKSYEDSQTHIHIGNQGKREFWQALLKDLPSLDVLIDDGGHTPEQQIVTLEEILPRLNSGGVYICEDIHGERNPFAYYLAALSRKLNFGEATLDNEGGFRAPVTSELQSMVDSIHFYSSIVVIEKRKAPLKEFLCPRRGSEKRLDQNA